jgi:hypothetical protein
MTTEQACVGRLFQVCYWGAWEPGQAVALLWSPALLHRSAGLLAGVQQRRHLCRGETHA